MRLFNHTKVDDNFLKKAILEAAKSIGMAPKTRHVPVKIVATRKWNVSGVAYKGREVSLAFMSGKSRRSYAYLPLAFYKMIKADGYMLLRIPLIKNSRDALRLAEAIFTVAAHEWRHIRDTQRGLRFDAHKEVVYWDRCQEIRAKRSEKLAGVNLHKSASAQEAVLNLAINIEELVKKEKDRFWKSCEKRSKKNQEDYMKTAHGKKTASILTRIAKETRIVYG